MSRHKDSGPLLAYETSPHTCNMYVFMHPVFKCSLTRLLAGKTSSLRIMPSASLPNTPALTISAEYLWNCSNGIPATRPRILLAVGGGGGGGGGGGVEGGGAQFGMKYGVTLALPYTHVGRHWRAREGVQQCASISYNQLTLRRFQISDPTFEPYMKSKYSIPYSA